jgi:hypothetical protein
MDKFFSAVLLITRWFEDENDRLAKNLFWIAPWSP